MVISDQDAHLTKYRDNEYKAVRNKYTKTFGSDCVRWSWLRLCVKETTEAMFLPGDLTIDMDKRHTKTTQVTFHLKSADKRILKESLDSGRIFPAPVNYARMSL